MFGSDLKEYGTKVTSLTNLLNFSSHRWLVFSRILAAIFGGYALATSSSLVISQLLMLVIDKYQAIHIGLLLTFLVYACAAMWVFSIKTAQKAWLNLISLNLLFLLVAWLLEKFFKVMS